MKTNLQRWLGRVVPVVVMGAVTGCAVLAGSDSFTLRQAADDAYRQGQWRSAERYYRRLAGKVPRDAYAHFRLGNVLARQQRYAEAIAQFDIALALDPDNGKIASNLATVYLFRAEELIADTLERLPPAHASRHYLSYRLAALRKITAIPVKDRVYLGKSVQRKPAQ